MKNIEHENEILKQIASNLAWQARRYCDGRQSYVTSMFNDDIRKLISLGVELNPTADGTIWARDAQGRAYDHLTPEEAALGDAPDYMRDINEEIKYLRQQLENIKVQLTISDSHY